MGSKRNAISEYAKDIIKQCRDPEFAAAYLLKTLRDSTPGKRERIAWVLGRIAEAHIVRPARRKKVKR